MGYYITNVAGFVTIPKDKIDRAYDALVELNDHDELKTGGCCPEVPWDKTRDKWNPNKWFAWFPYDYPDKYKSVKEIFEQLGFFAVEETSEGLEIAGYDDKRGNEYEFLRVIAPFVKRGSYLDWVGEDGAAWRMRFDGLTMEIVRNPAGFTILTGGSK